MRLCTERLVTSHLSGLLGSNENYNRGEEAESLFHIQTYNHSLLAVGINAKLSFLCICNTSENWTQHPSFKHRQYVET